MKVQQQIQAINEPFFTADGSTDSAQLLVAGSPMFEPTDVTVSGVAQTDWRGMVQLYPYQRTQFVQRTNNLSAWSAYFIKWASLRSGDIGPDGSTSAWSFLLSDSNGGPSNIQGGIYCTGNAQADLTKVTLNGIWARADAPCTLRVGSLSLGDPPTLLNLTTSWAFYTTTNPLGSQNNQRGMTIMCRLSDPLNVSAPPGTRIYIAYPQMTQDPQLGLPIQNTSTTSPATQVDYTSDQDEVDFGYTPVLGANFTWSGTADIEVLDATATLLAQYANSPAIVALVDYMNQWIDPSAQLDQFYNLIWNVETAQGIGLDIWGTIVDIPRTIQLVPPDEYFGFETSIVSSFYPFNSRPFYAGPQQGTQYTLSDDAYRVLIMTKALANISSFTAPSLNALFRYLFAGRGSCYALDLGGMQMQYVFNFALQPWEASVLQQPQLMPRPAGVGVTITVNP